MIGFSPEAIVASGAFPGASVLGALGLGLVGSFPEPRA